jgi:hypothetical protein
MFRTCCTGLFTERSKTGALDEITEDSSSPLTSGSNSSALKSGRDAVGGGREQRKETKKPTQAVFLEIVGALYLNFVKEDMDPFCIVKVGNKEVHRTKVIPNDTSPIWTSKTKACCLLHLELAQGVIIQLCHTHAPLGAANVPLGAALVGATKVVGEVHLRYSKLIQGKAQREEYHLLDNLPVTLAIKFRPATREDSLFFQKIPTHVVPSAGHAQDIEFKHVETKPLLANQKKIVDAHGKKQTAFRVWPFPDPDRPAETTFLTKQQLWQEAKKPSIQWVEGGSGEYGTVHLEILGCDDLPNMDTELVTGKTDAFCACVFEDTLVRSSIIHDSLNPRWMPWSYRAFTFQISHPSSILLLGVFDYDDGPLHLNLHDPIGRVVIHTDEFENDTVYTLTYPLYHGDTQEEDVGYDFEC